MDNIYIKCLNIQCRDYVYNKQNWKVNKMNITIDLTEGKCIKCGKEEYLYAEKYCNDCFIEFQRSLNRT